MRILYVGMGESWGNTARGAGYEERFFRDSLARMPNTALETFDFLAVLARRGREDMSRMLSDRVRDVQPDLLFMVLLDDDTAPLRQTVKDITEDTETVTMLWVCDDPWQFEGFSSVWAPCVDWIITTDVDTVIRTHQRPGLGST